MVFRLTVSLIVAICSANAQTSDHLVISQIYGGGGATTGSPSYNADYVQLFNPTASSISLSGYSLQYGSSTGTTYSPAALSGTVPAGRFFLIQTNTPAQGVLGPSISPPPDLTTTTSLNLSASAGKILLVSVITAQTGGCPGGSQIVDKVGYGSGTNCAEGAPTPTLTNTTAVIRTNPCRDTDSNSVDFTASTPAPQNSASAALFCGPNPPAISVSPASGRQGEVMTATVTGTNTHFTDGSTAVLISGGGVTLSDLRVISNTSASITLVIAADAATGLRTLTVQTGAESAGASFTINAAGGCTITHTIEGIQGSGILSPLVTSTNTNGPAVTTTGVVTAVVYNGLFIQQIEWPAGQSDDPASSNGLFVFTSSQPAASLRGRQVCVTGPVLEYVPSTDLNSPPVTEITTPNTIQDLGISAPLPSPVSLSVSLPDPNGVYNQLERYEGMRVSAGSLTVVGATEDSYGNFFGVVTGQARPFREPGIEQPEPTLGSAAPVWNGNPERLKVNSSAQPGTPSLLVSAGQTVANLVGPLHFDDRTYTLMPDLGFAASSGTSIAAIPILSPQASDLTIGNFNLEKFNDTIDDPNSTDTPVLTPAEYATKLAKASLAIRNVLRLPDVLAVDEIEKLSVLQDLAARIQGDLGSATPVYDAYLLEGNDVSGIDIGFLVKRSRVQVISVIQENKDETFQDGKLNDRPPLVLKARAARPGSANYLNVTIIAVHQRSLIGIEDPATGARVREKRAQQTESLARLIRDKYFADNLVVLGDFNAYEFNDGYVDVIGGTRGAPSSANQNVRPVADLFDPDLVELAQTFLPVTERYSYSYRGNFQMIDHILVNQALLPRVRQIAIAHNDAEFSESLRTDAARPERVSDHDAPVAYFTLPEPAIDVTIATLPSGLTVVVDGTQYTAPRTFQFAPGSTHTIGTPSPQTLSGTLLNFDSWSDTGTQIHTVTIPDSNTAYAATFAAAVPLQGRFGIGGAVISRVDGQSPEERVYTVRLSNVGSASVTGCQLTSVTFGTPGILLRTSLPVNFGSLTANGGNNSQPLAMYIPPSVPRFVMNLIGACSSGTLPLAFQTSVTTFR